jgi:hypothetical protein
VGHHFHQVLLKLWRETGHFGPTASTSTHFTPRETTPRSTRLGLQILGFKSTASTLQQHRPKPTLPTFYRSARATQYCFTYLNYPATDQPGCMFEINTATILAFASDIAP